jgi:UDP-N-acetyl-D-glucosamine dehydrogenase
MGHGARKVVIVGQGYVGLPLAVRAVEVGYRVVGFDLSESRVKLLSEGTSFTDDVPSAALRAALDSGRYQVTSSEEDCEGFDVGIVTVPTPLKDGNPDLSYIEEAAAMLGRHLRKGSLVVLESTTYPGTTTEVVAPVLEESSGLSAGRDFLLGYSPERIDPGNRTWTLVNTPKVVSGIDAESAREVKEFYDTIVATTVEVSSTAEAELTKLLENTFRHVNVALVNELAMLASELGVDIWEAIDAASTKPFGFMPFRPGPGVGGHCLPIDPSYLSWRIKRRLGRSFRFVELANRINSGMPDHVVWRLSEILQRRNIDIRNARILLLGLAYKADSGDARESPALAVADRLLTLGADLRVADPHVVDGDLLPSVPRVEATREEMAASDVVVLLVDHRAFDLDAVVESAPLVFDTRNRVRGDNVERL